jgi:choline dehydrogenase-like flavoprotein
MFIDALTLKSAESFAADICIIGAGPAGLAMALELGARSGLKILLIESGSFEADSAVEDLNRGTTVGDKCLALDFIRARRFAGTVTKWRTSDPGSLGTKYLPLNEIDFQTRPWVPHSGWPFDYAHLVPWYKRAVKVCGVGPFDYSTDAWSDAASRPWPLEGTDATSAVYQLGPDTVFMRDARAALEPLENVRCLLNATVTGIDRDRGGEKITGLAVRTLGGATMKVSASSYVLAAGGIENARLLLAWGVGNQHDQVGRYYTDHPETIFTDFVPADRSLFNRSAFYDRRPFRGIDVLGRLALRPEAMEREKLLNMAVILLPCPSQYTWLAIESLRRLNSARHNRSLKPGFYRDLFHAVVGLPAIAGYLRRKRRGQKFMTSGWSRWPDNSREYRTFQPVFYLEQSPDADNRITLGRDRDALGMPRPVLHWRWRDADRRSVARGAEVFDAAFRKAGLGQLRPLATASFIQGTHHPAGTTRMNDDPRLGVVDRNGKVHGAANLFVTGASVFPTSSFANPMLTIIALALRLADHLSQRLV